MCWFDDLVMHLFNNYTILAASPLGSVVGLFASIFFCHPSVILYIMLFNMTEKGFSLLSLTLSGFENQSNIEIKEILLVNKILIEHHNTLTHEPLNTQQTSSWYLHPLHYLRNNIIGGNAFHFFFGA